MTLRRHSLMSHDVIPSARIFCPHVMMCDLKVTMHPTIRYEMPDDTFKGKEGPNQCSGQTGPILLLRLLVREVKMYISLAKKLEFPPNFDNKT